MSSHREAPEISKDPVADSTDVYAFVSPDNPNTVTLIANYVPLQGPDGGPNFYEFGDDVLYEIKIDNDGNAEPDVTYQFRFTSVLTDPETFLYNTGPIQLSTGGANWNRRQYYSVTRVDAQGTHVLASDLPCPPCNIGPLSTPDYDPTSTTPDAFTKSFVFTLPSGETVFAGQRAEGFYVDLGAIFDLGDLRPFANLHNTFGLAPLAAMPGVNSTKALNVHSIAVQLPISRVSASGTKPTNAASSSSVIGVWTTASRQQVRMWAKNDGESSNVGPYVQVSRLGNPLFNEVLIPLGKKDFWNSLTPASDHQFATYVANPQLAQLLPILYTPDGGSTIFPNLATLDSEITAGKKSRADLEAILLTGIPAGVVTGFQNYTGATQADMLRLNLAIAPTTTTAPSNLGLIGGDPAGFPNGRRVFDDVTTIELRALAGVTYALVDKTYTPDKAAGEVTDGLTSSSTDQTANGTVTYLTSFPYLGAPHSGYTNPSS